MARHQTWISRAESSLAQTSICRAKSRRKDSGLASARDISVARCKSFDFAASAQASLSRYPVKLRKIRSAGSRVLDVSFQTEWETRSVKNEDNCRLRWRCGSVVSGTSGGRTSKRMDARCQRFDSYSWMGRTGPAWRDDVSKKEENCNDGAGVAIGIPERSALNVVCSICRSSSFCACLFAAS